MLFWGKFIRRIGCKDVTPYPNGIDVSDAGDVLVGNSHGNTFKIAVFNREGGLTTEFECSHVKVRTTFSNERKFLLKVFRCFLGFSMLWFENYLWRIYSYSGEGLQQ